MADTRYGLNIASKTEICTAADYAASVAAGTQAKPGTIVIDPSTNAVLGIVDYAGNLSGVPGPGNAMLTSAQAAAVAASYASGNAVSKFTQPRILKQFTDLTGVAAPTTSNASVTYSVDPASPFGCPALKLVITFNTTAGRVEVVPAAVNIPLFSGHVGFTIWIDDETKVGQVSTFIGTDTGFGTAMQIDDKVFNGSEGTVAGPRVVWAGPTNQYSSRTPTINTFTFGTNTLSAIKLRLSASNPIGTTTVWVKDCFIFAPQRPVAVFSFDDGYESWITTVLPALATYGYKGTFGIDAEQIDGGGGITTAHLQLIINAGHQVCSHNQHNYRLRTLCGDGTGEQVGTSTALDSTAYLAEYNGCRNTLEALGCDPNDFMYHPWVQGGIDTAGVDYFIGAGVDVARGAALFGPVPYGAPCLYNSALNIHPIALTNAYTLSQIQAQALSAYNAGGLFWVMGHDFGVGAGTLQWDSGDFTSLVAYISGLGFDVLTARQFRDRLGQYGLLWDRRATRPAATQQPKRLIGVKTGANFNSTGDQTINLTNGTWIVTDIYVTKPSVSLTTAQGGFYTQTAKGGTKMVETTQAYTTLVAATNVMACTMLATPTVTIPTNAVYMSLTTAQGSAATADVFVYGRPA